MTTTRKTTAAKKQEADQEATKVSPQEDAKAPEAPETPQATTEAPKADVAPQEAAEAPKMLTVVVVSKFIDKNTKETRKPGDVIEVTRERLDELDKAGMFVVNPAK